MSSAILPPSPILARIRYALTHPGYLCFAPSYCLHGGPRQQQLAPPWQHHTTTPCTQLRHESRCAGQSVDRRMNTFRMSHPVIAGRSDPAHEAASTSMSCASASCWPAAWQPWRSGATTSSTSGASAGGRRGRPYRSCTQLGYPSWLLPFGKHANMHVEEIPSIPVHACPCQALRDLDTDSLRKLLGNVNLPSWINFPGGQHLFCALTLLQNWPKKLLAGVLHLTACDVCAQTLRGSIGST